MIKKLILASITLLALVILANAVLPRTVSAASINEDLCNVDRSTAEVPAFCANDTNTSGQTNPTDNSLVGPNGVLTKTANALSSVVGIISVFVVIIGGLMITTASGDSNRVSRGRNAIIYALVGVGVAVGVRLIVAFVLSRL